MTIADFPQFVAALAILLSVVIRSLRNDSSWTAVEEGRVTAQTLRDLTGIMEFDQLQEAFGAPRLDDGVFPVTRSKILQQRTTLGYLFGDRWLDGGSAVIAIITLLPIWPIWGTRFWLDTLLMFASAYQVAGWVATMQFQRRR
jgi:hypothetical protein